jgi:hypothetical protein
MPSEVEMLDRGFSAPFSLYRKSYDPASLRTTRSVSFTIRSPFLTFASNRLSRLNETVFDLTVEMDMPVPDGNLG